MNKADILNEIAQHMREMSEPTKHCVLEVARMLKAEMNIPNNLDYLRSRLIGTEENKDFQIAVTAKYFEMKGTH